MSIKLFEYSPLLEVTVKNIYWRSNSLIRLSALLKKKLAQRGSNLQRVNFDAVLSNIRSAGVREGDILIVHSSMKKLRSTGLSPDEIIDSLKSIVSDAGTLALPAFTYYSGEPTGVTKLDDTKYRQTLTYDMRTTASIWTGVLAKCLVARGGAVRSRHPINSMVALGPHASDLMRGNLRGNEPTPCGPGSSWEFCYRKNAKIVALGVDLAHSLTMIHVAEDAFQSDWPVDKWYRSRKYRVIDNDYDSVITVRERRHNWSVFYAERSFSRDLRNDLISKSFVVDGLKMTYCESERLINYLRSKNRAGYPYKIPFLKSLKKKKRGEK